MLKKRLFETSILALSLFTTHAHAQTRDPVSAQALFDDARRLMAQGQNAEACPKLAESQRLDPGIGTAFNLADCYEKIGRVASAWALFLEVVSQARASGESDREAAAKARASRLEPRLPKLKIRVGADNRPPRLEITRDGIVVGPAQWDSMVPVDPGPHDIVAKAPSRKSYARTLNAEEGVVLDFELPPLALGTEPAAAAPAAPPPPEPAPQPEHKSGGLSPWVYGFGAVGIVGVGVGTTFAIMANSSNKDSKTNCQPDHPNSCNPQGIDDRNTAINQGNVATVAFVVGGAGIAGALVVWLVTGSANGSSKSGVTAGANVAANGAEFHLAGRF